MRNKDYPLPDGANLLELYRLFMEEFRRWHEEL